MISFLLTLKRLIGGIFRSFRSKNFQALFVLALIFLISGTIFYVREEGLTIVEALYFCVMTLSTVGHPDFVPATSLGKVFTIVYVLAGTGIFLGLMLHIAYAIFKEKRREENGDSNEQKTGKPKKHAEPSQTSTEERTNSTSSIP